MASSGENLCRDPRSKRSKIRRRRKKRTTSSSRSGRVKHRTNTDFSYVGDGRNDSIRSCTSSWDITSLESVGIFYNAYHQPVSEILDMVLDNTGMFGPLTEEQKEHVKSLQDSMNFCYSNTDVAFFYEFKFSSIGIDLIEIAKKDLKTDNSANGYVQDFIKSTVAMIQIMRSRRTVPEVVFVDLFKIIVKMCGLNPSPGEVWQSEMKILQHRINSTSDVVITRDFLNATSLEAVSVVSIVEVENTAKEEEDHMNKKTKPSRSTLSNTESSTESSGIAYEVPLHEKPAIFKTIDGKVLGQHGGELLVHLFSYGDEFKKDVTSYHPGMIVIGTKVTLTLLVCSFDHIRELTEKSVVEKERSIIYYSETKDLFKKEDRDQLLESFARMNNAIPSNTKLS